MLGQGLEKKIKALIRSTWLYKKKIALDEARNESLRTPLIPKLSTLIKPTTSIISSNCFAGRVMQDLSMRYNSPTLGLYFWADDYIEFLKNLRFYLTEVQITFTDKSKYALGNERRLSWKHWYPVGLLNNKVEIHFLHYHSEQEAAEKWYRRASRVNFEDLLVVGMEQNLCTTQTIVEFDRLSFKKKMFFSTKNLDLESNIFMPEFSKQGEVGDPYRNAHIFYDYMIRKLECF